MNILKRISPFLLIGAVLIVLPGYKRRSTHTQIPILPAMEQSVDYAETKRGITLQAKQLSKTEAEQILGKRAGRLWHQSKLRKTKRRKKQRTRRSRKTELIIPIQLSIRNQRSCSVTVGAQDIELQLADYNTVTKRLHRSAFVPPVGIVLAGIAITYVLVLVLLSIALPFLIATKWGSVSAAAATASLAGAAVCVAGFVFVSCATPVVATGKAIKTTMENRRIKRVLDKNSFADTLHVAPDKSIDTLIFVAEDDYKETFVINVQQGDEENTQTVPFSVTLNE